MIYIAITYERVVAQVRNVASVQTHDKMKAEGRRRNEDCKCILIDDCNYFSKYFIILWDYFSIYITLS